MVPETSTFFIKTVNPSIELVKNSLAVEDGQCLKEIAFFETFLPKSMSLI